MQLLAKIPSDKALLMQGQPVLAADKDGQVLVSNTKANVLTFAILGNIGKWWTETGKRDIFTLLQGSNEYDEIHVIISSLGGAVDDGFVIYDMIAGHAAKTVAFLMGQVASAATFIACAFDEVVVSKQCTYMIHRGLLDPGFGNATYLRKVADRMEIHDKRVVDIYARRTGLPNELVMDLMEEETWFEPEELVEMGFADRMVDSISLDFSSPIQTPGQGETSPWAFLFKGEDELANASRMVMRQRGFRPISNSAAIELKQRAASFSNSNPMNKFLHQMTLLLTSLGMTFNGAKWMKGEEEVSSEQMAKMPEVQTLMDALKPSEADLQNALALEIPKVQQTLELVLLDKLKNDESFGEAFFSGQLQGKVAQEMAGLKQEITAVKSELKTIKLGKKPAGQNNGQFRNGTTTPTDEPSGNQFGDDASYLGKLLSAGQLDQETYDRLISQK